MARTKGAEDFEDTDNFNGLTNFIGFEFECDFDCDCAKLLSKTVKQKMNVR